MTMLAGALARSADRSAARLDTLEGELKATLSRRPTDRVDVYRAPRFRLALLNIGAFGESAANQLPDGTFCALVGEPLIDQPSGGGQRNDDLRTIHAALDRNDHTALARATGVFAGVHFDTPAGRLRLFTDKLGIRPLYYWLTPDWIVFASTLRVLESLTLIPRVMDLRGVTEAMSFGFPLADRTPYAGIHLLGGGDILDTTVDVSQTHTYWRWQDIGPSRAPIDELARQAHSRFADAVSRRAPRDGRASAFLSGGLDSRCIVAALRERHIEVDTYNFSLPGAADQVFARDYAARVGTRHHEVPLKRGDAMRWSTFIADAMRATAGGAISDEEPMIAWSGDGGSVGMGHVYMDRPLVDLLRSDRRHEAVRHYLTSHRISVKRRILSPRIALQLADAATRGVEEELGRWRASDPGRAFYLFLMHNDQHRHLAAHFENMDLHRTEFQLPFFDSAFLELVMSVPLEECLDHVFYYRWLAHFPAATTLVPWQAYPGHAPCPLPVPKDIERQWDGVVPAEERRRRRRRELASADAVLAASPFPHEILNRPLLLATSWLHRLRLRDYGYLMSSAETYLTYWNRCHGKVAAL